MIPPARDLPAYLRKPVCVEAGPLLALGSGNNTQAINGDETQAATVVSPSPSPSALRRRRPRLPQACRLASRVAAVFCPGVAAGRASGALSVHVVKCPPAPFLCLVVTFASGR